MHNIDKETLAAILDELQHRPYGAVYKLMDKVLDILNTQPEAPSVIVGV